MTRVKTETPLAPSAAPLARLAPPAAAPSWLWDVFCQVIDNHGDVGVCWRLARELAARGHAVRLWLDDLCALSWLAPGAWSGAFERIMNDKVQVDEFTIKGKEEGKQGRSYDTKKKKIGRHVRAAD